MAAVVKATESSCAATRSIRTSTRYYWRLMSSSMVWGCDAGVALAGASKVSTVCGAVRTSQFVVSFDRRIDIFDHPKLRLATRNASGLCITPARVSETPMRDHRLHATPVASEALFENSRALFAHVCVNPRALSAEAAEFMLSVAASHSILSPDESHDASHADLTLQGVRPETCQPALLVCTTTMFAAAVERADVEKSLRRAELWRRAVGPAFSVSPVVAGYGLSPEVAAFAEDMGVLSCDVSK